MARSDMIRLDCTEGWAGPCPQRNQTSTAIETGHFIQGLPYQPQRFKYREVRKKI